MKCTNCGHELDFNSYAYSNLDTYKSDNQSVLIASNCCSKGYKLHKETIYVIKEYNGDSTHDDWGARIHIKNKN